MKLIELHEQLDTRYLITYNGGSFSIAANSATEAKQKAKQKLPQDKRIISVKLDKSLTQDLEGVRQRLIDYVKSHRLMTAFPLLRKGFLRKIGKITSVKGLNSIEKIIRDQKWPPLDDDDDDD